MDNIENDPGVKALIAACEEYEKAATKPSISKLAAAHGLHPQVLRGGLMAYRLVTGPSTRPGRKSKLEADHA